MYLIKHWIPFNFLMDSAPTSLTFDFAAIRAKLLCAAWVFVCVCVCVFIIAGGELVSSNIAHNAAYSPFFVERFKMVLWYYSLKKKPVHPLVLQCFNMFNIFV